MDIKEVPIGQEHIKKEKLSSEIIEKTQRYLSERGVSKNDLTEKQWEFVAQYMKGKQKAKLGLILYIIATLLSISLAISSYKSCKHMANNLASLIPPETIIINKDGTKNVIEVEQEVIENYGKANALMGFAIGFFLFLGATSFSKIIGCIVQIRIRDKTLEAFLPINKPTIINDI